MKKFSFLILIVLLSSCSLLMNVPYYQCYVDAYTMGKNSPREYVLLKTKLNADNEFLNVEVERLLESMLSENGFRRVQEHKPGVLAIVYDYNGEIRQTEVTRLSPVYGATGTSTNTSGKVDPYMGNYSETSRMNINRGIVGFNPYTTTESYMSKYVRISAMSLTEDFEKDEMYWQTASFSNAGQFDIRKMINVLILSMSDYIDKSTHGHKEVKVRGEVNGKYKVM